MNNINKALIINLNWRLLGKIGRLRKYDPLVSQELLYIASDMDRAKIENRFIDLWGEDRDIPDIKKEIKEAHVLVFCSAPSYHFWQDGTVDEELPKIKAKEIKEINPDIEIIIVGPHGSILPETFFDSKIDYIVKGEPDLATTELVKRIFSNEDPNKDSIHELSYVCYRKEDKWIVGSGSAVVEDMTKLPVLKYDKVDPNNYSWPTSPEGYDFRKVTVFESSRGCPFSCVFCFRKGFRGKYRQKSIEQISAELDILKKQGVEYFFVIDEIFGINFKWVKQVCEELKKRGFKWGCESRPEYFSDDLVDVFASTGCVEIRFGLESANMDVLKKVGKGSTNLDKFKYYVNKLVDKGVNVKFFCIAGLPGSSKKTIKETLDYVMQFDLLKVNAATNIMLPYPGTVVWQMAINEGKKLRDWNDLEKYAGTIGNDFKTPKQVMNEVARFNAAILQRKSKLKVINNLKKGFKNPKFTIMSIGAYFGCIIIRLFPGTYPFFSKLYRFLVT